MRDLRIEQAFTRRDEGSLIRYLNDLSRLPLISPEDEVRMAVRIRMGDQLALEKLVSANLRFVVSVAKKYQGQGLPLNDLVNEGNIGLIRAARTFDESKGFKFISYAVWWIRQAMMLALSDHARIIRTPMNQVLAVQKIQRGRDVLEQQFEREPTAAELAEALEMYETAVVDHLYRNKSTRSLDDKVSDESELELQTYLTDPNMQASDEQALYDSLKQEVNLLLSRLQKREQKIIQELFGLNGSRVMSIDEVARRNDLSRERIRQIKAASMKVLRSSLPQRLMEYL